MTTLSSDTDNGASAGARIYSQVMELEKQLKAQIKEKRAFHPDVRNIRAKLREKYVEIILTDYEVSEKHDIATSLWHFVYYNMIEEFRTRIRYAASAPVPGAKVPTQRVSPQKLLAEFKNFISEATKFYNALILKLKKKYGLPQADLAFEGPEFNLLANKQLTEVKRSCHRLFIHLGDLARYKELHSDGDNYAPDWKVPASYYYKAVSLWPSTGHPHNQLAVLATYMRNDFLAVYHYFRSLAVDDPFTTARGNLILLFERNRQQYAELSDQKGLADVQKKGRTGKEGRNSSSSASPVKAKIEVKDTESDSKKSFFVRFVRLNGILFTKTSLETFPEVYSDTVRDLEKLLSLDLATLKALFISDLQNPAVSATGLALGALQVVSILMFSVPNGNSRSTYADAVQHSTVSKHALTAAFKVAGCFMSTCAKSKAASGSPLLPASLVFMEWLACRQEMLVGNGAEDDKQSNARTFFWKESSVLLNSFCDGDNSAEPNNHVALWEDHELRGFAPLLPAHLTLDFSRRQPTNEETQVRVQRFVAAGKAVVRALDGSGKGLVFDEDMGRFLLAGERRERRPKEKVLLPKAVDKAVDKQVIDSNPHPVPQVAQPALVSAPSLSLAAVEDEEEVIVFKPVAKGTPVLPEVKQNDLYGSLGIPAGLGTEVSASFKTEVHEGQQSAVASGGSNPDYGSISDSLKNIPMQAPTTAFERPAIPSFMTSLHASSMPMANGAGTVSSGYPFSSNKFDGFQARYAGLSYGTSSTNHQAGVIGQPKEIPLASNLMIPQSIAGDVPGHSLAESAGSFNTTSSYPSSLAQDLLYKLQNVTVGKENPEASFARQTASGYGTQTERIPVVEKVNTELVRPPVSIGDIVKDGSNAVRAGQASVRPPPGFGPIPLRAVGGNKLVSQPAARPLPMDHAIREDNRLLDNAGWLDAYPGGKTAGMPRPLYNTDFGIWSTANNGLPVPKSTSYPFPGMGVRTLQEIEQQQQQSLLQQPQQQALLQQPSSMQQQSLLQQPSSMQQLYGGWKPESGIHGYDAQQLQLQQLQQQQQQQQVLQQQLLRQFRPQDPFVS